MRLEMMQLKIDFSMRTAIIFHLVPYLLIFPFGLFAQPEVKLSKNKSQVIDFIDAHEKQLVTWSNQLWEFAEPSLRETKSVALLVNIFNAEGFTVQENVMGMPTVFIATYGNKQPVIGLFGEYDADPNASNKIVPRKEEFSKGGYGHGGHHNLLATGSLGAALAIKNLIKQGLLNCTIRYYGTTAEGGIGAKAYLARDGYFDDLDFSLYWHPAPATWASTRPWDALVDFDIIFSARPLNVIRETKDGSTTLDALELMIQEMKTFRKEMSPLIRMNYSIHQDDGNLDEIGDTTRLSVRIQCARQEDALRLFHATQDAATRTAMTLNVEMSIDVHRAMHQFLPNVTAMTVVQKNMELLGPMIYTEDEQTFVKEMQQTLSISPNGIVDDISLFADESNRPSLNGYASDIGDPSWIAPEVYFVVRTLAAVPMHQWPGTAFSAHAIGHKGMLKASKILSMTIVDFVESKSLQQSILDDFKRNKKSYVYKSLLTSSPPTRN
jgi:aminobenzoyl-glutamate utilization protein B